jgi:uncharacterized membrane protein (DUF4010 family)
LLIGFERERSHRESGQAAGARTFALLALAGATAAAVGRWGVPAGLLVLGGLLIAGYVRTSADDPGVTTEVAGVATYLLGSLAWERQASAAAVAIGVVALLASKARIHSFVRDVVTDTEVDDAVKFLVMAFVVLPLLPHRKLGPYGVLDPARLWQLVVALTGISWAGYVATRAFGARRGMLMAGLAGGFVSASATTAALGRTSRASGALRGPLGGAYLASLATFVQLAGIVAVADRPLLARLWPALVAGAVVLLVVAFAAARRPEPTAAGATPHGAGPPPEADSGLPPEAERGPVARPFGLRPALVLAGVLTAAVLAGRWVVDIVGPDATVLATGAAGLADAHAGALAAATLHAQGQIGASAALLGVAAALATNTVVKCVLAFTAGGRRFGWRFCTGVLPAFAVFGAVASLAAVAA